MRNISVTILKNDGLGSADTYKTFSSDTNIIDISNLQWTVESDLTKVTPGSLSLRVVDFDDTLWPWIKTNLAITGGSLPPFIVLTVGGIKRYVGIVPPGSIEYDEYSKEISINSQDWSQMASKIYLTPYDSTGTYNPNSPWQRKRARTAGTDGYISVTGTIANSVIRPVYVAGTADESKLHWVYVSSSYASSIHQYDKFTSTAVSGTHTVEAVISPFTGINTTANTLLVLSPFTWPDPGTTTGTSSGTFTRQSSSTSPTTANNVTTRCMYNLVTAITADQDHPCYALPFDNIDGLVPGDTIETGPDTTDTKVEVLVYDLDFTTKQVIIKDPITEDVPINTKFYLNADSAAEMVFVNAKDLIRRALNPYFRVDFSRFSPTTLSVPVFGYIGYDANNQYEDVIQPVDIQPNLSTIDIKGVSTAWYGTPETTWTTTSWTTKFCWTSQTVSAPGSQFTDETATLAPFAPLRNRVYPRNWKVLNVDNGNDGWDDFDAIEIIQPPKNILAHDVVGSRRILTDLTGSTVTYRIDTWNGSTWINGGSNSWPLTGTKPLSIAPTYDVNYSGGSGYAWMVLTNTGRLKVLLGATNPTELVLTNWDQRSGRLVNTPYGLYLVGRKGYGKVIVSGGTIQIPYWLHIGDDTTYLFPNTFCAYDASTVYCLGSISIPSQDASSGSNMIGATYLFRLKATPSSGDTILSEYAGDMELISKGLYRNTSMMRDPSGRLIGLLGGRLYQISNKPSLVIERINPQGQTAIELVEHVCQVINAIPVPNPKGYLEIVSRDYSSGGTTNITIDETKASQTNIDQSFYSIVRVGGKEEDIYFDAYGQTGGDYLEVSSHPFIFSKSQCRSIAQGLVSYFGVPKRLRNVEWMASDLSTAPVWESLEPLQKITINSGTDNWLVKSVSMNLAQNTASAVLRQY